MKESLNEAVAALWPEMTAALQRLVRKKSVEGPELPGKPFGADVDACFTEALTLCRELGFETTDLDRYIGWCEIGSGDEMVAVLGHLDVVPEGEGWHHPPYGAEIVDGRLFGRGAIDDKGPVVASLFALKAIRDLNIPLRRRVRLLFGLNEETNDRDVFYLSLIHISEPTRRTPISYAVFCLKKKKSNQQSHIHIHPQADH